LDNVCEVLILIIRLFKNLLPLITFVVILGCSNSELIPQRPSKPDNRRVRFRDIIHFDHFILLEENDNAYISQIQNAFFLGEFWIVFDSLGQKIYQYRSDGKFIGMISKVGEGPNEYQFIRNVSPFGDNSIIILTKKRLMAFNLEREYLWSLDSNDLGSAMPSNASWYPPDILAIIDLPAVNHQEPRYKLFRLPPSSKKPQFLGGFGQHYSFEYGTPFRRVVTKSMVLVNDEIWVGSPYESHLDIYNLKGEILKRLPSLHPDGVDLAHATKSIKKKHFSPSFGGKKTNRNVLLLEDVVVASLKGGAPSVLFDFYGTDGTILYPRVMSRNPPRLMSTHGKYIVGTIMVEPSSPNFEKSVTATELTGLRKAGLDRSKDQNFLWVGRLVDKMPRDEDH